VTLRDWWRIMRREILMGLALGSVLGLIGFLRIFITAQFSHVYGDHYMLVALTVALTLVGIVLWGTLSGSMLPLILQRCGLDRRSRPRPSWQRSST
jgi:magnesium transporter